MAAIQLPLPELLEYDTSEQFRGVNAMKSLLLCVSKLVRFVETLGGWVLTLLFNSPSKPSDFALVLDTGCEPESIGLASSRISW